MAGKDIGSSSRSRVQMEDQGYNESLSTMLGSIRSFRKVTIKKKKKLMAPTCNCGKYAILFESSTKDNSNEEDGRETGIVGDINGTMEDIKHSFKQQ
ncbi:uncharacterized protein DS421_17g581180 [Arachis hypogaea]|nr:uncharacterized protein DS421_17g581180 [Arachis hypogaea]